MLVLEVTKLKTPVKRSAINLNLTPKSQKKSRSLNGFFYKYLYDLV